MAINKRPVGNMFLYGTIVLLGLGFVVLVALVFAFSSFFPSLFGKCVAIVNIDQELSVEGSDASLFSGGSPGSEEIANAINDLNNRDDVGAVVFVINSPGGSVVATREVYNAIDGLEKPKVAYFREVAASGGYYISTPSDYIISEPNAITGSIGVIATFTDMSSLFDKIGLNTTTIKSGEHKDIGSIDREMTDEEEQILQSIVDEVFQEFKQVVLDNRGDKLDRPLFNQVLDGRIVTGRQAKKIGLVDDVGSKQDAISKAAELGGIAQDDVSICEIPTSTQEQGLFGLNLNLGDLFGQKAKQYRISYE